MKLTVALATSALLCVVHGHGLANIPGSPVPCASDNTITVTATEIYTYRETVTVSGGQSSSPEYGGQGSQPSLSAPSTSISTHTSFVTIFPASNPVAPAAASSFYFVDNNGTTSWLDNIAPPSTYSEYVTETVLVTVYPKPTPVSTHGYGPSPSGAFSVSANSTLAGAHAVPLHTSLSSSFRHVSVASVGSSLSHNTTTCSEASATVHSTSPLAAATDASRTTITLPASPKKSTSKIVLPTGASWQTLSSNVMFSTGVVSSHRPISPSTFSARYTNTTSAGASVPTTCGESGDFVLNWDDMPVFAPTDDPITDVSEAPPVFNPYHHLTFSNGFVYIPPPTDPFPPVSAPPLIMFLTNETGPSNNPDAGLVRPGEISAGVYSSNSAFWFNAYSAYLACDNSGPDDCTMSISGYTYLTGTDNDETLAYQHNVTILPCPGYKDCHLQKVDFPPMFKGLSGLQIQAYVGGEQKMWFMDDLSMGWSNNTCAAGLLRQRSR